MSAASRRTTPIHFIQFHPGLGNLEVNRTLELVLTADAKYEAPVAEHMNTCARLAAHGVELVRMRPIARRAVVQLYYYGQKRALALTLINML